MSSGGFRKEQEDKQSSSGSGLGTVAAVVGVAAGVGAALYYFFGKDEAPSRASYSREQAGTHRYNHSDNTYDEDRAWREALIASENSRIAEARLAAENSRIAQARFDEDRRKREALIAAENSRIAQARFAQRSGSLEECSICMEVMSDEADLWKLPCGHTFHVLCAGRWTNINTNCPNCRMNING